jgi:hypothetical protein
MFTKIKEFLFGKPAEVAAPYKVEAPAPVVETKPQPAKCGCGRSASGLCVGLHKLSQDEWAKHPDNKATPAPKKAPAKKQQFEKKAAAPKAPAKPKAPPKPRAPRKAPEAK